MGVLTPILVPVKGIAIVYVSPHRVGTKLGTVAKLAIHAQLRNPLQVLKTGRINGRGERIRTSGLLVPNQALYQAEPRPADLQFSISERKPAKSASMPHWDQ